MKNNYKRFKIIILCYGQELGWKNARKARCGRKSKCPKGFCKSTLS